MPLGWGLMSPPLPLTDQAEDTVSILDFNQASQQHSNSTMVLAVSAVSFLPGSCGWKASDAEADVYRSTRSPKPKNLAVFATAPLLRQ